MIAAPGSEHSHRQLCLARRPTSPRRRPRPRRCRHVRRPLRPRLLRLSFAQSSSLTTISVSILPYTPLMGQANSRSSSAPDVPRPARQSASSPSSSVQRECTDSAATASSAASKRSRRSSLGRTVRALLPHSRSAQDGPSSHDPSSSLRKRWRSSRRSSKRPSSLSDCPEGLPNPDSIPNPSAQPHSSQDTVPEEHTVTTVSPSTPVRSFSSPLPCALLAHPSPISPPPANVPVLSSAPDARSSSDRVNQPPSPDGSDPEPSPASDAPLCTPQDEQLAEQIGRDLEDFLAAHHPDNTFVQGSSRDGQTPPPPVPATAPSPSPAEPQPSRDTVPEPQPQPPRHFQPSGPLVVVQGVVNTSDAAAAQANPVSRSSGSGSLMNSLSAPPLSHRRSSSTPLSVEDRHGGRNRLSAFLPRPSSMLGRRPASAERPPSYDSPLFSDASSSLPDHSSYDVLPADTDIPSEDHRANDDSEERHRPLSPGSIDVLGTLLRCAHVPLYHVSSTDLSTVWRLLPLPHLSSHPVSASKAMVTQMPLHLPGSLARCHQPQLLVWAAGRALAAFRASDSIPQRVPLNPYPCRHNNHGKAGSGLGLCGRASANVLD